MDIISTTDLNELMKSHASILRSFQECHDLCVQSCLFTEDAIDQIDTCATDFKDLSQSTVIVVKRIAVWLDGMLTFFKDVDRERNPAESLKNYGAQAKELAKCFKAIAQWGRDVSGSFYAMQDTTRKEAKRIKARYQEAEEYAEEVEERKENKLRRARRIRDDARATEGRWNTALKATWWSPVGLLVTGIGSAVSHSSTTEAEELEAEAADEHDRAVCQLVQKRRENEKAQFIASKAEKLVGILSGLEKMCDTIAAFWTVQANNFDSQGAKMATNQVLAMKTMKSVAVQKNIAFWTKAKDELSMYAAKASIDFDFATKRRLRMQRTKVLGLPTLDLSLYVPANIDTSRM